MTTIELSNPRSYLNTLHIQIFLVFPEASLELGAFFFLFTYPELNHELTLELLAFQIFALTLELLIL